jgi:nucleoid DNA-binding protein
MTLTKNKMVRAIGQRTRLKNRDVQAMLEALVEVWTEELISNGRIELENFLVLEVIEIDRGMKAGTLWSKAHPKEAPRFIYKVIVRASKTLRTKLKHRQIT